DDVLAVGGAEGYGRIEHWDGSAWSVAPIPHIKTVQSLNVIAVISSTDIWAVGESYLGLGDWPAAEAVHWDGTKWSMVPYDPSVQQFSLMGLAAVAPDDIWAVGFVRPFNDGPTLIEHWAGTRWARLAIPNPGG